jgi:HAE1 family hydrophobic/amphiphilic exporter-1/multidrug efflux pump
VVVWLFHQRINFISYCSTGLVVDDGIVVTKIYLKKEEGMTPIEAAIKGSNLLQ